MDSASQKRKPGSGFTRRSCYVWLQRPSPLGFSTPVSSAPFISLWFHGNVQNAQQVAVSPGGEGSARGPSGGRSALHSGLQRGARRLWMGALPSVCYISFGDPPTYSPTRETACGSLHPGRRFPGSGLPAPPWPGRELRCAPFPSPAASTLALIRPLTSHLTGSWALAFSTTLHSIRGCGESSGGPLEGGQCLRSRWLLSCREGATPRRTALVRGLAAAFTTNAKPKGSWPTVRMCPSGESLVLRRNEFETGWEQFLSNFQVSSFHRELIEQSL